MNLMVPTLWCKATLRQQIVLGNEVRHVGELVDLPYGVALQGLAQGVVGAIKDADEKHLEALHMLDIYGGDSWFPPHFQTIGRVKDYLAEAAKPEASK